jgi:rhamnulokinase
MMRRARSHSYLAFDLGAESGRAVLGTLEDGRLSFREIHRFANSPLRIEGHLHWDVTRLLGEMKKALRTAVSLVPGCPASLGIDTWGVDFGLLGSDGTLLGLPFCYRDSRTEGAMEEFFKLVPRESLYGLTGIQFMPFNTLFQVYAMVRERSPLLDAAADLLFMPDLFNFLLTGKRAAEYTIASTSQMMNPRTRAWIPGLFQAMGLSKNILRDVVPPGTVLGQLGEAVASETSAPGVPVVATAGHDTAAAVAAVPAEGDDWAYISSGTWSLVGVELASPLIDEKAFAHNFTNEGGVGGTTRFLKNVSGLWLLQQCRKSWGGELGGGYEELVRLASEAPPFSFFVDPDHPDFLNPPDMPRALAAYCRKTGQSFPLSKAATVRSILESLALKYRRVVEELRAVTGREIRRLHIIGGGSKNGLLCRFTAEATGLPVYAGPAEATAVGNLLVQAMALGHVPSHGELRRIVRESSKPELHEPSGDPSWGEAAERFLDITKEGRG